MRVAFDRLIEKAKSLRGRCQVQSISTEVQVVGGEVIRRAVGGARGLGGLQGRLDDAGDAGRDLVLKLENILERAVEPVGPEMRASGCVDQLCSNTHPAAGLAHRSFEDVAHAEFARDLLHINRLALVGEGRIAGDDKEPADARQRRNDLLDHAICEIFLLGVAAHIGKRHYRDRRPVGERQHPHPSLPRWRGRGSEGTFRANSVDAQWPDDILELLLADIGEPSVDFATHLAECVL